jgi:anthranilate 1,2-dioxygenase large subunit/terephthalate 1,2-dioxygenase oxygenase component alpha subunit
VAFEKGVRGKGGMPAEFRKEEHGLQRLRTHRICGLIFGTASDETPDFASYVGPDHIANIERVCGRPIEILGQYSQLLHSNWKLYMENVKDPYHASLLHAFNGVMKMDRLTMEGGIKMGSRGWHHISYSKMTVDPGGEVYQTAPLRSAEIAAYGYGLRDPSLTDVWDDYGDKVSLAVQTIFPSFVLQQLRNCLAFRVIVPRGPRASELMWTAFGYADDDDKRRAGRLRQANMMGPAGLISMEDGMVGALIQRGIEGDKDKSSVMELGGRGIEPIEGSRASEGSVRGFWTGYRALMGM